MEDKEKSKDLETENRLLRERLMALEKELLGRRVRSKFRILRLFVRTYATKPLYSSVSKLVEEVAERRIERDTIKEVLYATLRRLTRVGAITMLIALAPLTMAILQTYYLKKQNEKFDIQNERIEQQTFLQEAERRSSLVFMFDNVLDKIDDELRHDPVGRQLSPQLIGRIVALTKALKPYRYLEGDTITSRMTSPERGQVLLSLLASKLNQNTNDQIFLLADFSYASLSTVNLDGAYLRNINLAHSILESVSLTGADLRNANFEGADLKDAHVRITGRKALPARFDFANFHDARIMDCDFGGSSFDFANFAGARLHKTNFQRAFFNQSNFEHISADTLDFSEATFIGSEFSRMPDDDGPSKVVFRFAEAQMDSASYEQIRRLPLRSPLVQAKGREEVRVNRDTFYVDDKVKPVVVENAVTLYRIQQ